MTFDSPQFMSVVSPAWAQFMVAMQYGRHTRVTLSNGTRPRYGRVVFHSPAVGIADGPIVVPEVVNPGRSAHAKGEES